MNKVKNKTEQGEYINCLIQEGLIVPVKITCKLIENEMSKFDKTKNIFLVDGFPRNEENYNGFCENFQSSANIVCIIFLECPQDVCVNRIESRGKSSGRVDDNIVSLVKRFNTYNIETVPLINSIQKENKVKICRVDANISREIVFKNLAIELDKILIEIYD